MWDFEELGEPVEKVAGHIDMPTLSLAARPGTVREKTKYVPITSRSDQDHSCCDTRRQGTSLASLRGFILLVSKSGTKLYCY